MQKINLNWLKENRACEDGYNAFKELLGDKEYLTIIDIQDKLDLKYIRWFAWNTECAESLNILSKHKDLIVVGAVAWDINTPKELLVELTKHKDIDVVCNVAGNVNTPIETLTELSKHENILVVAYAKETLKKLGE